MAPIYNFTTSAPRTLRQRRDCPLFFFQCLDNIQCNDACERMSGRKQLDANERGRER